MADYRMELHFRDGTYIGTLPFADLQGELSRGDQPDQIRFKSALSDVSTYVSDLSQLRAGLTEVTVYRNDVNIFTGPIWEITASSESNALDFGAEDVSSYLKRRRVDGDYKYTKKKAADIAWDLITKSQALSGGNLGITLGTKDNTSTISVSYTKKSVGVLYNAIEKLGTGTPGFDWKISPDRVFNAYNPRLAITSGLVLEYRANILRYSLSQNGRYIANNAFVKGKNKIVSSTFTDADSISKFGLRHYTNSDSELKSKAKADAKAKQQLNLRKDPVPTVQMVIDTVLMNPLDDGFGFGHIARIIIDDGWVQYDSEMRCNGYQVTVSKQGSETFTLYMKDLKEIESENG